MKRLLPFVPILIALAGAASVTSPPVVAQTTATATNVPVIPHEAVPNFFKNPPGIYTGENMGIATNSKGNIYIYHRAYETRLFEYSPQGTFIREIGRNNYGFAFAHSVRVDAQDNIWAVDEGTDMLVKFNPEGRVLMVIGRREDPVAMLLEHAGRRRLPRPQREVPLRPPDRRRLRSAGQHLRVRRLLRRPRREVRQERPLRQGGRQARQRQPGVQHAALDRHRLPGQRLRRRPRQRPRAGARQRPELEGQLHQRRQPVGACACRAARVRRTPASSTSTRPTRGPTARRPAGAEFTGEVYKMELDGTIVGKFGKAGKAPGEFATIHQMDCRDPNVIYTAEINNWRSQKILLKPQPRRRARTRRCAMIAPPAQRLWPRRCVAGGVARRRPGAVPEIAFDTNADLLRTPQRRLRRRSRRRRRQFEGPDLRLHADRASLRHARRQPHVLPRRLAAVPVRSDRQVRPRAGPGRLRLQRRLRPARRSAGQRLDHRRRRQPGGEVRHRRPRRAGARPQA